MNNCKKHHFTYFMKDYDADNGTILCDWWQCMLCGFWVSVPVIYNMSDIQIDELYSQIGNMDVIEIEDD